MLTICQYCRERVRPAELQIHLKQCFQYRKALLKQAIEERTKRLAVSQDEQKPKEKQKKSKK